MGKEKIVIDTNNLISALGWNGKSRELLRKVIEGEYDFYISIKQLVELKRVLNYPRLKFTEEQKKNFLEIIYKIAKIIDTKNKVDLAEDDDDNRIIECAIESKANYIISGDIHLKKLKKIEKIKIISVNEFLNK